MLPFSLRAFATCLVVGAVAEAQLQRIDDFGDTYDTQLVMDIYAPPSPAESPAVILAVSSD